MERTWRLRCLAYLMDTSPAVLFDVIQLLNCVQFFVTPMDCNTQFPLSATISQSLIKSMSLESMTLSNHLILCHCLLLPSSSFPSIRVFSSESALHIRQQKYWSFSFIDSLSNEYSGWFPLGLTDLISLLSKEFSRVFSNTTV